MKPILGFGKKSLRPEAIQWLEGTDIPKKDSVVKHEKSKYHDTAVLSGKKYVVGNS
ncbi:hypothetical protein DPMN_074327 [Dreissena polymorpha]|uniref:Uncharacterized protein n=1 Tax=Dreissena polymorpha TaxID=45954 RepID=A0A9D3YJ06_DREPO|nr:hypothetical protein DPMN_074327 [Dreissena polymorpha]